MNPFVDIAVRPAYGRHLAVVTWKVQTGFELAKFFVYRSLSGTTGWELLNDVAVQRTYFSDETLGTDDQFRPYFYRLLMVLEGREYDSPVIGTLDKLTRSEYRACRKMMNAEYKSMDRGRNGIRVLLYTPLLEGRPAAGVDSDTGQQYHLDASDAATDSYGQKFIGGFAPPITTWLKLSSIEPLIVADMPNGESTDAGRKVTARMLSFPSMRRNDLIVHPELDNRYAVGETVQGYFFRGGIPIAYDVALELLPRTDDRYRVPVPILSPDPRTLTV